MPVLTVDRQVALKAVGERGEVAEVRQAADGNWYVSDWLPGEIVGVARINRVPFLSMSGYAEIPTYKVRLSTGQTIEASPMEMRRFAPRTREQTPCA